MPDYDQPGYDAAYDLDQALTELLRKERTRAGLAEMRPLRRYYLAIAELNWCVKADGLYVGVAGNDPDILPAAPDAAKALKLRALHRVLAQACKCLPPKALLGPRAALRRIDWYDSPAGTRGASRLEQLEERFHDSEPEEGYVGACLTHALRNPGEFFESE
jgi:hypothetical protein